MYWFLLRWKCKRTSCYYYNGNVKKKKERNKEQEMCVPKEEGQRELTTTSAVCCGMKQSQQWDGKSHIQMPKVHWLYFRFNITNFYVFLVSFHAALLFPSKSVTVSFSIVELYFTCEESTRYPTKITKIETSSRSFIFPLSIRWTYNTFRFRIIFNQKSIFKLRHSNVWLRLLQRTDNWHFHCEIILKIY